MIFKKLFICLFSFYCYFPNTIFFLLHSMVTQLHIHVYILFSHIIVLHHKWLDIVPSATQQDLTANSLHLLTPSTPSIPLPPQFIVGLQCSVNFLLYSKVTLSHTHICTLFFSHYPPSQVIRHSSQCYTAGSHCLSTPNAIVCIY